MATTLRVVLDTRHRKSDGTYPLKIRVTVNREQKYLPLGVDLHPKFWDEKRSQVKPSLPNAQLIGQKVNNTLAALQGASFVLEGQGLTFSPGELIEAVEGKKTGRKSFFEFSEDVVRKTLDSGRAGTSIAYKNVVDKIRGYFPNKTVYFEDLTLGFLEVFTDWMLGQGLTYNGIAFYLTQLRTLYNKAIRQGIVEQKHYPFTGYRIKRTKTIIRALSVEEIQRMVQYSLEPGTPIWHHRNYFLLSFCLRGAAFSDVLSLTANNIVVDRIVYQRKKTGRVYSIRLEPWTVGILDQYNNKGKGGEYLIPPLQGKVKDNALQRKKDILQAIRNSNKYILRLAKLCGISRKVTTYYSRYSWANIAKSLGYSKDLIAEALGHEYGNSVTGIYLDQYSDLSLDEANKVVLDVVFNTGEV